MLQFSFFISHSKDSAFNFNPCLVSIVLSCLGVYLMLMPTPLWAHGVAEGDGYFIEQAEGALLLPFIYLGAKHMVTGYDHLLFLFGVIFFLYRPKDVAVYVSLFALGHSLTLLLGVLSNLHINAYLVDAIISFSVVYKAMDNLGAFKRYLGFQPSTRLAVLIFGFFHGFGLAAKLQDLTLSEDGLVANILAFNIGVELGQLLALGGILLLMNVWRSKRGFLNQAFMINVALMSLGFMLMGYQLTGYFVV